MPAFREIDHQAFRIKEETATMWQDFFVQQHPAGKISFFFEDFHTYVADAWTVTEVGTSLQKVLDARNGILSLISGASENDGSNLQLGGSADDETIGNSFLPASGKNMWFECSIASAAWTQHELFVGLHIQDTSVAESRGSDYIGFRSTDGSAVVDVQAAAGSVASVVASVLTPSDSATTFYKLGFKVTSLDKIEFYVNDALIATITGTIPTTAMKLTIAHTAGEAVAKTLNIDYIYMAQDR